MRIRAPKEQTVQVKDNSGMIMARLHWNPGFGQEMTGRLNRAQAFVDSEVLRLMDPLTPMRGKTLIRSGLMATKIGSGTVQYNAPYARYHYYGKLMVGCAPKKLTDIDMSYQDAPQRGPKWFERMKVQSKDDIRRGAGEIAAGKHKN